MFYTVAFAAPAVLMISALHIRHKCMIMVAVSSAPLVQSSSLPVCDSNNNVIIVRYFSNIIKTSVAAGVAMIW